MSGAKPPRRIPGGLEPIREDDAFIERALTELSIPTLMMSLVHISGDASLLDAPERPTACLLNEVQGFMSEDAKARVRAKALDIIRAYRDGGCVLPPPPSPETIHRMMNTLAAAEVPGDYVPMLMEELELDGRDHREAQVPAKVSARQREGFHVVVVGCGMSGLLAAIRLQQAGISYTVIEKNPGIGGTWYENRYPGCRVDVGNHFYCYSFEPNPEWSEFFARREEIQRYFERCADTYGVRERVRFNSEVVQASWDEAAAAWCVRVRGADGAEETLRADALISAVGQLNRAKFPDIPGRERFRGESLHSSAWNERVAWRGKRVAVIGTGASAFQIVPTIAEAAERVTVFQRSAQWMFPNPHYHEAVGAGKKWALTHLPYYARWYRFYLFWPGCDGGMAAMSVDPEWPHQERSVSAANEAARLAFSGYLEEQVGGDASLLKKVIPDYVCLGKRTLQDNGSWLGALKRSDVELVTCGIAEIREHSVRCEDGSEFPVDLVVYATGFHANRFLWPMEISGRGGVKLHEQWGEDPTAYLGISVPGFPNFFCVYGPGTNLAHAGSIIFHSECQVRYIMGCLGLLMQEGAESIECRREVHDAYVERLQDELSRKVWAHPSIRNSWYQGGTDGRINVLSPWRLRDYWEWTQRPNPEDYLLR